MKKEKPDNQSWPDYVRQRVKARKEADPLKAQFIEIFGDTPEVVKQAEDLFNA